MTESAKFRLGPTQPNLAQSLSSLTRPNLVEFQLGSSWSSLAKFQQQLSRVSQIR